MKYQVLFSLKTNEEILKTVVCCSRGWRLKGYNYMYSFDTIYAMNHAPRL